ncbi:unnamed protein product [Ixodes hexagonus]
MTPDDAESSKATRRLVAVIGAGSSGLPSIKSCLEEGLDVVCFERTEGLGGLWRYRESPLEGVGSVARNTVLNSSKEFSAYSDFPPGPEVPNFLHHTGMLEYLRLYSEKFRLEHHIRYNHLVTSVRETDDRRWTVRGTDTVSGVPFEVTADAVMVCSGHHAVPKLPNYPGLDQFAGRITHAHDYRRASSFEDRRVLVVGLGNSGGDIAAELSYVASQVYVSTRRGTWVATRLGPHGQPMDLTLCTRALNTARSLLPFDLACRAYEHRLNRHFDHKLYQLQPSHRALDQQPFVNDVLPARILTGTVQVKGNVSRFSTDTVEFEDGSRVAVDDVILATGYVKRYDFLPEDVAACITESRVELFKFIFPAGRHRAPAMAFIGLVDPIGGFWPVAEMQARYACRVLSGNLALPDVDRQSKEAAKRASVLAVNSDRYATQVHWIAYMDELASLIGVKPNLSRMALKDPVLFRRCFTGPCLSYQFRLGGPHAWAGARDAILGAPARVASPLTPQTSTEDSRVRRAAAGALDVVASCGIMIALSYAISLAL